MTDQEKKYLLSLQSFSKFGPAKINKLWRYFQSYEQAWQAKSQAQIQAGLEENLVAEFSAWRRQIDPADLWSKMQAEKIALLGADEADYPESLRQLKNAPPALYYRGDSRILSAFQIAVVGSRQYTAYGQRVTEKLIPDLARSGLAITSGLALGIDSLAHWETLKAGGKTIAVLGAGLDRANLYPAQNQRLAEEIIASGGALISELPPGTEIQKFHFPQRNRIIAGLARGVLLIEAAAKSGALITAAFALEENRDVLAVPGSIFSPQSAGTNQLIKQGAIPVFNAEDIIEYYGLAVTKNKTREEPKTVPETELEKKIFLYLGPEPKHINELIRLTGLDTSVINSTLTLMELKGLTRNVGGLKYVKM